MRSFHTALLALLVTVSVHAGIRVTEEKPLAPPLRAPLDGEQSTNVIATDGDQFMDFWTNLQGANVKGVNVAHVAADGRILSSRLAMPDATGEALSVTWTGSVYLAIWREYAKVALFAATFSKDGDLLSGPRAVVTGMKGARSGALASNGHRALLLYCDADSLALKAAIFDADGNLLEADVPIRLPTAATKFDDVVPIAATDGQDFALVWRTAQFGASWHDFHLIRVDEDAQVIGSQIDIGRVDATGDFGVAFGGGLYAIASVENYFTKPGLTQRRLVRFSVDPRRDSVTRLPAIDVDGLVASLFWNGNAFVAYWVQYTPTSFAIKTVTFSGAEELIPPTPATPLTGDHPTWTVSMAASRHNAFAAWIQSTTPVSGAGSQIYGALLDPAASSTATADGPTLLSLGWSRQFSPSMATSTTGSLLVWVEDGYVTGRLLGARTDVTGALIDAAPFEIATGLSRFTSPAVVFTGDRYFVAWQKADYSAVITRTVSSDGVLGPPIALGPGWGVAAASNGSTTLVVFSGRGVAAHLVGYRFDASGTQIDTSPLIISDGFLPHVASNGTDFFVVWNEGSDYWQYPSANMLDVLGRRVSAAGAVDAAPLPIATGPDDQRLVAIASDGRDYVVAFQLSQYPPAPIATKIVLREGQLGGTTAIEAGTIIARDAAYGTALSGDATGYWSAYLQSSGTGNILRLDQQGKPASPTLSIGSAWTSVALGHLPGGAVRIAYARAIQDGEFVGTSLVFFRSIGDDLGLRSHAVRH
jgi:hypothetical protein